MALLDDNDAATVRRDIAADVPEVRWTKAQIKAGVQAIEDLVVANKLAISNAIDVATSPFVATNAEKKKWFRYWAAWKLLRDNF